MSGFYIIGSKISEYVLDCEGGCKPGAKVIPWTKHGKDNQLWYDDPSTGTIRCKAANLCLDIENGHLVVKPFQQGDSNQQWFRDGAFIRNRIDRNKALDILKANKDKGAQVSSWNYNGGDNQQWKFEFVGGQPPVAGAGGGAGQGVRKFYIMAEMNGKVLDISGGHTAAGTKVVLYHKNEPRSDNQLFYTDQSGFIRACINDMAFSNSSKGDHLKMQMAADPRAQWKQQGNKIINGLGEALDIKGGKGDDGAELCSWDNKDQDNQRFRLEYV